MRTIVGCVLIFGCCCQASFAQAPSQPQAFEVASVKPHQGEIPSAGGSLSVSGPRLNITVHSLFGLLMFAYRVQGYQIPNLASLDRTYYDIVAQAAEGRTPTKDEFRLMMQSLLADRFKLKAHRESKEMPVYALVVSEKGHKLKESAADAGSAPLVSREVLGRTFKTTYSKISMADLAQRLRGDGLDRTVLDMTGLTGDYNITLTYCPEYRMSHSNEPGSDEISIFTALQEQLGLKLERRNAPVELLIVDHVEKPSEN